MELGEFLGTTPSQKRKNTQNGVFQILLEYFQQYIPNFSAYCFVKLIKRSFLIFLLVSFLFSTRFTGITVENLEYATPLTKTENSSEHSLNFSMLSDNVKAVIDGDDMHNKVIDQVKAIEVVDMDAINSTYFFMDNTYLIKNKETQICNAMNNISLQNKDADNEIPTVLNVTIDCRKTFEGKPGTGNWLQAIYYMRLAAITHDANVDFSIKCDDAEKEKLNLILPWVMGYWSNNSNDEMLLRYLDGDNHSSYLSPKESVCSPKVSNDGNWAKRRGELSYLAPFMIYEFRRMAVAVGGIPYPDHPSAAFASKYLLSEDTKINEYMSSRGIHYEIPAPESGDTPLIPSLDFDDVAIHIRCGDVLSETFKKNNIKKGGRSFFKFESYAKTISNEAKTIGIITIPFDPKGQNRIQDKSNYGLTDKCRAIVTKLQSLLEKCFPRATIRIRNTDDETIVTSYVRMIMANQTFASDKSFSIFPTVASFGTGYFLEEVRQGWAKSAVDKYNNLVVLK